MRTRYPRPRGRIAFRLVAASALMAGVIHPPEDRSGAASPAAESYFMVIYSAEKENTPVMSHCFATFAKVSRTGGTSEAPRVELHHINWFSVRGHRTGSTVSLVEDDGRPTRPEPGENRTTRDALRMVLTGGRRVSRWGPYEIDRGLYERALRQIELLEGRVPGRKVLYKAIDLGYRNRPGTLVLNCIHAVSDIEREPAPLRTWTTYGDEAARKVVRHLRAWIKGPAVERPEVWALIWEAIWRGAPERMADTIVRAEIDEAPGQMAQAGGAGAARARVTLTRARLGDGDGDGKPAERRGEASPAASGG